MAVMATLDIPGATVSTMEIERPDRPYTYETIERLRAFYGEQASLFFIVGSDSFEEIHTWREPMRVLTRANLIVAARPGYEMVNPLLLEIAAGRCASADTAGHQTRVETKEMPVEMVDLRGNTGPASLDRSPDRNDGRSSIFLTDYVTRDISSTEIRRRASEGLSIRDLVPEPVARYIDKYELYRRT
jgi:nicotinate-nucleotide adenylyltransferase